MFQFAIIWLRLIFGFRSTGVEILQVGGEKMVDLVVMDEWKEMVDMIKFRGLEPLGNLMERGKKQE